MTRDFRYYARFALCCAFIVFKYLIIAGRTSLDSTYKLIWINHVVVVSVGTP